MKRINIYINKNHLKKIKDLRYKHRKSLSALADIISSTTLLYLKETQNYESLKKLGDLKYQFSNKQTNSIHLTRESMLNLLKYPNRFITNCLDLYFSKTYVKHLDISKEIETKLYQKINNKLQTTNDPYWNLNEQIRIQKRAKIILERGKQ